MQFHDVRFPAAISFGSTGGPERRTEVVTLSNGFEERNAPWAHSRRRYEAGLGVRSRDDLAALLAFFEARGGRLHAFRWKDWADFHTGLPSAGPSPLDEAIGTGDGARQTFALFKTYASGGTTYSRPISRPVAGTVRIALDGTEQPQAAFDVDTGTGRVTFALPPAEGAIVTAGFAFDVPARFDTDRIVISAASFDAGEVPDVPVIEVRES